MPRIDDEKKIMLEFPEFEKYAGAFKTERSAIERVFGLVLKKFRILAIPFNGRGPDRVERLGQIFTLACQLTNLSFAYECKDNMVNANVPTHFNELLRNWC